MTRIFKKSVRRMGAQCARWDKMRQEWETYSDLQTEELGRSLGEKALSGEVYALDGDLGAGKTVFARGFARGLGIQRDVTSPTFTIVHEYREGRLPLFHFDVYRLPDGDALWETGWDEYLEAGGVCLVEWASLLKDSMPENTVWLTIERDLDKGSEYRRIIMHTERRERYDHSWN